MGGEGEGGEGRGGGGGERRGGDGRGGEEKWWGELQSQFQYGFSTLIYPYTPTPTHRDPIQEILLRMLTSILSVNNHS